MSSLVEAVARKKREELLRKKAKARRTEDEAKLSAAEKERARKDAEGKSRAERWKEDPALYALDRFGIKLTVEQVDIARKLVFGKKKFHARKAANKVGKTCTAAVVVWWTAECHGYDHVHLLSSTGDNLEKILWAELSSLYEKSRRGEYPLPESCAPPKAPTTGFVAFGCHVYGWTSVKVESLGGLSGPKQLFVVDEGSSERFDLLYDAIRRNTQSGETRWLVIGNPTRNTGAFHSLWHGHEDSTLWDLGTMPAARRLADGTVVALYDFPGTGLSNPSTVEEWIKAAGSEADSVRIGVFGEFPLTGSRAIFSYEWISQAVQRYELLCDGGKNLDLEKASDHLHQQLTLGVDVARFGEDDTVIFPVRGQLALDPVIIHGHPTDEVVEAVLRCVDAWGRPGEVVKVNVDATGSAGVADGVIRAAKERKNAKAAAKHAGKPYRGVSIVANDVNVARKATQDPTSTDTGYVLVRDQLWFAGAQFLRDGGILKPNLRLQEDMLAPTFMYAVDNRKKVESKEEIRKRLKRSPDLADAYCLAVWGGAESADFGGHAGATTKQEGGKPATLWGGGSPVAWEGDSKPWNI
jgi:phage terminase large subunit